MAVTIVPARPGTSGVVYLRNETKRDDSITVIARYQDTEDALEPGGSAVVTDWIHPTTCQTHISGSSGFSHVAVAIFDRESGLKGLSQRRFNPFIDMYLPYAYTPYPFSSFNVFAFFPFSPSPIPVFPFPRQYSLFRHHHRSTSARRSSKRPLQVREVYRKAIEKARQVFQ